MCLVKKTESYKLEILKTRKTTVWLPYAFAEYFSPGEFWKTSGGKEIKTLPGDIKYYFNY